MWESRKVLTFNLNDRVLKAATLTENESLKQKFLDGDMIALDAEYHSKCLLKLYREATLHERGTYSRRQKARQQKCRFSHLLEMLCTSCCR